ncbi:MAG: MBOAT family protein [Crocinitomicaceae bacterium]|nr:MBOAT family protein [Crocinitomicaceae bacterium]
MLFSSVLFLFKFLPIVLVGNFIFQRTFRNLFLLISSLFFYFWGEEMGIFIMLISIGINYLSGIALDRIQAKKAVLIASIVLNLGLLVFYKYFYFLTDLFSIQIDLGEIALPLGISFFTFQGLSYVIDVYKGEVEVQKNPLNIALYISLFPQLIAGPIVRYKDISNQITSRNITESQFVSGIKKFIRGLFKKVVIANNVGLIADLIMVQTNAYDLPLSMAWLGIISYTLQIYFDFSGYSDMAIGIGRMLGFNFKENFRHPYFSFSIREFWRRWHISLSTWFRDYLYIPLGGNRKGKWRMYFNLVLVFFLTGLWHGASWNFVLWGMIHGLFLILERFINLEKKQTRILSYCYTMLVVTFAWVFFKIENFDHAGKFLQQLIGIGETGNSYYALLFLNNYVLIIYALALLFVFPTRKWIKSKLRRAYPNFWFQYLNLATYMGVLIFTIIELSMSNYNPFIYFRF